LTIFNLGIIILLVKAEKMNIMIKNNKIIKLLLLILFSLFLFSTNFAEAYVRVRGYFRRDGTYVQPHYRSNPDRNPFNNWSFPGNINPYTGRIAPGNPDTYLKNYYNRRSSKSNFYMPINSLGDTTFSTSTVVCGENEYFSIWRNECLCNSGYKRNNVTAKCEPIICGENEYFSTWSNECYCKSGYKRNYLTGKCEKIICGPNEHLSSFSNECYCNYGYKRDYSTGQCEKIVVPPNARLNYLGNDWYCNDGYKTVYDAYFNKISCEPK
jgi:hypothetical protein